MYFTARRLLIVTAIVLCATSRLAAQQSAPVQQGGQQSTIQQQPAAIGQPLVQPPAAPQPPPDFQLNQLQETALDTVLTAWQQNNAAMKTFSCSFDRFEYDNVFGPPNTRDGREVPLYKNLGELSYSRPDKGSFQITETKKWQEEPAQPGLPPSAEKKGDWIKQPDAIGDHWVCDGKSVYQYRPDLKQLVEHPIPPQLQGQAIVDGPLPFLVGADANKLKQRYWMKLDPQPNQDPDEIWITALPKYQAQAADLTKVEVILDRQQLLPRYMRVWMPNRSHHVYIFRLNTAKKNNPLAMLQSLFQRPSVPFGWKRVVEDMPLQQAAQPQPPPR